MIIKVMFEGDNESDYIYSPTNIKVSTDEFSKWIYEDKTHPFWVYENGEVLGVEYRADAIVYWINKYMDNNSYILKSFCSENIDYDLLIKL